MNMFKKLFIIDEEGTNKPVESIPQVTEKKVEPNAMSFDFTTTATPVNDVGSSFIKLHGSNVSNNPHLESMSELYLKGFSDMNKDGIDFCDFYFNLSSSGNLDKTELYTMAFNMHKTMNPSISKDSFLNDAKYYEQSIENAYNKMYNIGVQNKEKMVTDKGLEANTLTNDIQNLDSQIRELTQTLNTKKSQLDTIDNKYQANMNDIDLKLEAHTSAKNKLIESIKNVINNINKTIN